MYSCIPWDHNTTVLLCGIYTCGWTRPSGWSRTWRTPDSGSRQHWAGGWPPHGRTSWIWSSSSAGTAGISSSRHLGSPSRHGSVPLNNNKNMAHSTSLYCTVTKRPAALKMPKLGSDSIALILVVATDVRGMRIPRVHNFPTVGAGVLDRGVLIVAWLHVA